MKKTSSNPLQIDSYVVEHLADRFIGSLESSLNKWRLDFLDFISNYEDIPQEVGYSATTRHTEKVTAVSGHRRYVSFYISFATVEVPTPVCIIYDPDPDIVIDHGLSLHDNHILIRVILTPTRINEIIHLTRSRLSIPTSINLKERFDMIREKQSSNVDYYSKIIKKFFTAMVRSLIAHELTHAMDVIGHDSHSYSIISGQSDAQPISEPKSDKIPLENTNAYQRRAIYLTIHEEIKAHVNEIIAQVESHFEELLKTPSLKLVAKKYMDPKINVKDFVKNFTSMFEYIYDYLRPEIDDERIYFNGKSLRARKQYAKKKYLLSLSSWYDKFKEKYSKQLE